MKRYMRGFVAVIASLVFIGGVASAQETPPVTCEDGQATITNTGPDSLNTIECVSSTDVHVTCSNNIYVVNNNSQTGSSGNANNSGNTTGGSSITGSATNENGTTVQIGATCAAQPAAVTPETPAPSQPVGGLGAGAPAEAAKTVAALPNTSSNALLDNALIGGTSLATLFIASRLGMAAYRRLALK